MNHLVVDTLGLVLRVVVHAANCYNGEDAKQVLTDAFEQGRPLQKIWADQSYHDDLNI